MESNYLSLVARVIKTGIEKEGPEYLRTSGGEYWCLVGNLNPEMVWRRALAGTHRAGELYPSGQLDKAKSRSGGG